MPSDKKKPADSEAAFPLDWENNLKRYTNFPYNDPNGLKRKFTEDRERIAGGDTACAYLWWLDYPYFALVVEDVRPETYSKSFDVRQVLRKHLVHTYRVAVEYFARKAARRGMDNGLLYKAAEITKELCRKDLEEDKYRPSPGAWTVSGRGKARLIARHKETWPEALDGVAGPAEKEKLLEAKALIQKISEIEENPPGNPRTLSPDELKKYADTFTGLAKDFRAAPGKYSDVGHLDTERERIESQAGRNMLAVIRGDSAGPWSALANFPGGLQTYDEDEASYFWTHFATAWLREQRPLKFKGKAGKFDLARPRRDEKGRLIPKSGVVVVVADSSGKETVYDDDEAGGIQTIWRGDEAALKRFGIKSKKGRGRVLAKDRLACARLQAEDNADHCDVMAGIILKEVERRSPRRKPHRTPLENNARLSPKDYATHFGLSRKKADALRKALMKFKDDNLGEEGQAWQKNDKTAPADSQFTFRYGDVRLIISRYLK